MRRLSFQEMLEIAELDQTVEPFGQDKTLTYDEMKEFISKNLKNHPVESRNGKMLDEIGYDEYGFEVARGFTCTKENCNCVGSWWDGNQELIVNTLKLK